MTILITFFGVFLISKIFEYLTYRFYKKVERALIASFAVFMSLLCLTSYYSNGIKYLIAMLIFAFICMILEYTFAKYFRYVEGSDLYLYSDNSFDIRRYTSLLNYPYYMGAFILFTELNKILVDTRHFDSLPTILLLVIFFLGVVIINTNIFKDHLHYPLHSKKFSILRYLFYFLVPLAFFMIPMFVFYTWLIIVYVLSSIAGTVGEGTLGISEKFVFMGKYRHWSYIKFQLLDKFTSILILPFWGVIALLSILCLNFVNMYF